MSPDQHAADRLGGFANGIPIPHKAHITKED